MPLVKIHVVKGVRTPEELKRFADIVYDVMLAKFDVPEGDRVQVIHQHEPGEIIVGDLGVGYKRTEKIAVIHIFQQGRDVKTKTALCPALLEALQRDTGMSGDDLAISISTNTMEDWSLARGLVGPAVFTPPPE
ncbi:hypothetical protein NW752_009392 [Fusarium irregulare]|uniref:Tautomerase n=1 Tax=Fusarium irregulare TaxID=2494466 RepID=A0A9W8U4I4_9HYPO|nr:hypothetical protein NW766_012670 [Fusarium irregulare]KAJ4009097.1 hypothetical protein NW752_009392 [Fusarium irregulare]